MEIKPSTMYWMTRMEKAPKSNRRRASIKRNISVPTLVKVDSVMPGSDKVGSYLSVRYTDCGRGTVNQVKSYSTGEPNVNFIFKEALG